MLPSVRFQDLCGISDSYALSRTYAVLPTLTPLAYGLLLRPRESLTAYYYGSGSRS